MWTDCAQCLASLCVSLVLIASPERIVIGGGVLQRACLYGMIRERTMEMLNGYIQDDRLLTMEGMQEYIVESRWGSDAGIVGALALGARALEEREEARAATSSRKVSGSASGEPNWWHAMALGVWIGIGVSVAWRRRI